ncbi:MAG: alpha/beta hydrolase, partial [Leptolyngbyaceae cyanobacterium CRU_2_3]|nr:alpha/beta hydrolase [Leptolyngbyaceae cyanobacterium CRU_2_3]
MVNTINILGFPHAYELSAPTGSSTVLVFVHGWLLSRHYWQPLVQLLQSEYQCLIYDARGFGESQPKIQLDLAAARVASQSVVADNQPEKSRNYSLKAYAEDLGCLLEKLSINHAWAVGHSLGGSVALWAAELYPDLIRGVICVNAGGGIYLKEEFERFRQAGQKLVKFRPPWLGYIPLLNLVFARMMVVRPLSLKWGR